MAAAGGGAAAGTGNANIAGRRPDGAGDPAFVRRHPATGQPLLRLERGRPAGAAAGATVAPERPRAQPRAGPDIGGKGRRNPVGGRGRGTARRAGAARRRDQAKLSLLRYAAAATHHCHNWRFKLAKASFRTSFGRERAIREQTLMITRRAFTAALTLTGLTALAGLSPLRLFTAAIAQGAADVAKPQSLPDMALGPANASVT